MKPLDEYIDKLEAGCPMDALVAEKVMGWRISKDGHAWVDVDGGRMAYREDGPWLDYGAEPWSPSTNIADAWEVVEKAWKSSNDNGIFIGHSNGKWEVIELLGHDPNCLAQAATAPLAICRAALRGVDA